MEDHIRTQMETGPLHILVVDQDEALLSAIHDVLEDDGHRVTTFDDGPMALEWLHRNGLPDLILLGMRLPSMSGWTFWSRMRFLRGADSLPVVVVAEDNTIRERVLSVGASGFLAKPFSLEQLLDAVSRAVCLPVSGGPPPPPSHPDF